MEWRDSRSTSRHPIARGALVRVEVVESNAHLRRSRHAQLQKTCQRCTPACTCTRPSSAESRMELLTVTLDLTAQLDPGDPRLAAASGARNQDRRGRRGRSALGVRLDVAVYVRFWDAPPITFSPFSKSHSFEGPNQTAASWHCPFRAPAEASEPDRHGCCPSTNRTYRPRRASNCVP